MELTDRILTVISAFQLRVSVRCPTLVSLVKPALDLGVGILTAFTAIYHVTVFIKLFYIGVNVEKLVTARARVGANGGHHAQSVNGLLCGLCLGSLIVVIDTAVVPIIDLIRSTSVLCNAEAILKDLGKFTVFTVYVVALTRVTESAFGTGKQNVFFLAALLIGLLIAKPFFLEGTAQAVGVDLTFSTAKATLNRNIAAALGAVLIHFEFRFKGLMTVADVLIEDLSAKRAALTDDPTFLTVGGTLNQLTLDNVFGVSYILLPIVFAVGIGIG